MSTVQAHLSPCPCARPLGVAMHARCAGRLTHTLCSILTCCSCCLGWVLGFAYRAGLCCTEMPIVIANAMYDASSEGTVAHITDRMSTHPRVRTCIALPPIGSAQSKAACGGDGGARVVAGHGKTTKDTPVRCGVCRVSCGREVQCAMWRVQPVVPLLTLCLCVFPPCTYNVRNPPCPSIGRGLQIIRTTFR